MDLLFIIAVMFLLGCFVFRKKIAEMFAEHRAHKKEMPGTPAIPAFEEKAVMTDYKILAFNARDYQSTKELEDMMELRLAQCVAGLSKQGHKAEVEFHATGFVLVYLVKYSY